MAEESDDELLLGGHTFGRSTFFRKENMALSYQETEELLRSLETASNIITQHFITLRAEEKKWEEKWTKRPKRCPLIRACCRKCLYLMTGAKGITFTVILQMLNLVMLTLVDILPSKQKDKAIALQWGTIIMLILQIVNLVIVLAISVQLAKQLSKRKISGILLVQSYFATILLFAGIYTATFRLNVRPKSWKFIEEDVDKDPILLVELYCRFLFFSTSTATLCGSADALPKEWDTCILTSTQMLLSFLYFTSVIGHALAPLANPSSPTQPLYSIPGNSVSLNDKTPNCTGEPNNRSTKRMANVQTSVTPIN